MTADTPHLWPADVFSTEASRLRVASPAPLVSDAQRSARAAMTVGRQPAQRRAASKVPAVTVQFWIIKVLITGANVWTTDDLIRRFGTGGLGIGRWPVSLGLAAVLISVVGYLAATRIDVQVPVGS
jgi:uncharacterized membrane-anchored protein